MTIQGANEIPSYEEIAVWIEAGEAEAACREHCMVELDGYCEHGKPSWLILLGMI